MNLPVLKAKLTRAKKSRDFNKIVKVCNEAFKIFNNEYWPDCWSDWQRARDDAKSSLLMRVCTGPMCTGKTYGSLEFNRKD